MLIELVVVVALIGLIAAIAFPHLLPAIAYGELEGAARHLATFGESAMAHCALERERVTVKIDLDAQEYWCVRQVESEEKLSLGGKFMADKSDKKKKEPETPFSADSLLSQYDTLDPAALEDEAARMQESFDRFVRMAQQHRAKNARKSIMDDIGPLFDKEFKLDDDEEENEEEIVDPLLNRTRMPESVVIETVLVGGNDKSKGVVEIDLTPLGFPEPVVFYVKNDDGDYFTVEWDPITAATHVYEGKEALGE